MQLLIERSHQLVCVSQPEWDEEQARLIDVCVTAVDHRDIDRRRQHPAQSVRGYRAARSATEDQDMFGVIHRCLMVPPPRSPRKGHVSSIHVTFDPSWWPDH